MWFILMLNFLILSVVIDNLFTFASVKTKGCPDGLRLYPTNLMRLVPPKGLDIHCFSLTRCAEWLLCIYIPIYLNV